MIWSTICMRGLGPIHVVDGMMNADKYIDVLKDKLIPSLPVWYSRREKFIYMHDGAPPHKAIKTKAFLEKEKVPLLDWPGNSPDFNPIENVWKVLKDEVAKLRPKSKPELIKCIREIWQNCPKIKETAEKAIESMPKRLKLALKAKGYQTKY